MRLPGQCEVLPTQPETTTQGEAGAPPLTRGQGVLPQGGGILAVGDVIFIIIPKLLATGYRVPGSNSRIHIMASNIQAWHCNERQNGGEGCDGSPLIGIINRVM